MEYILAMTFITSADTKYTMSISGVKPDITKEEICTLMDILIEKNIFSTKTGIFAKKYSANLIQKTESKYDLA